MEKLSNESLWYTGNSGRIDQKSLIYFKSLLLQI